MRPHAGAGDSASRTSVREEALVSRLATLAPSPDGDPDPEWRIRTRARLVAMAAVRTPGPRTSRRRLLPRAAGAGRTWRTRPTAWLAGAAAAVTGLAAVVALSADARPGDALYGVKRGSEQTRLALAGDDRGRTLLSLATTRLEEVAAVLADGAPAALVEQTLDVMDAQTREGTALVARRAVETGGSAPLGEVESWSAGQSAALSSLLADVPEEARAEAAASADLLGAVEQRAAELRAALGCGDGPATTGTDELGPVPAACPPVAGAPADEEGPGVPTGPDGSGAPAPSAPPPGGPPGSRGSTAPGHGTGSGDGSGRGSDPGQGSGDGQGSGTAPDGVPGPSVPARPTTRVPAPDLPVESPPTTGLPVPVPSLPTLLPGPGGGVRSPLAGASAPPASPVPEDTVQDPDCAPPGAADC